MSKKKFHKLTDELLTKDNPQTSSELAKMLGLGLALKSSIQAIEMKNEELEKENADIKNTIKDCIDCYNSNFGVICSYHIDALKKILEGKTNREGAKKYTPNYSREQEGKDQ
jgi:hypothetical protein